MTHSDQISLQRLLIKKLSSLQDSINPYSIECHLSSHFIEKEKILLRGELMPKVSNRNSKITVIDILTGKTLGKEML